MASAWSPQRLLEVSGANWQACALQAAIRLDLFTPLSDASLPVATLARLLGCNERALAMLLRALAAMDLLVRDEVGYRCPPPQCYWLDRHSSQSLGHILSHHHHLLEAWSRLDEAVRTGMPQRSGARFSPQEWQEDFLLGMHNLASLVAPKLLPALPLRGVTRLLDVGGGPGTWSLQFCRQLPELQAVLFDLPESRAIAEQTVARAGMERRIRFVGGDFLYDALGDGFDLAWLSHVLHAQGPAGAALLVARAAQALQPGGRLLIHEFILDDETEGPLFPALFSLNMLLCTEQGQSYSEAALKRMCRAAGLEQIERIPLPPESRSGVISAIKPLG